MSDTPETQEAAERWRQGKINIFDEMARLEIERNSLQDQRDFCMGEIERLRTEYFEMLDSAWGLIANAGGGNWDLQTEEWRQAARRWCENYLTTTASKEEKEAAK